MSLTENKKMFFSIGEVGKDLDLDQHVLRFWEKQFKQINPVKNNNRRLYSKDDIRLIKKIKDLLYNHGYTIKGVQKYLSSSANTLDISESEKQQYILDSIKQLRYIQSRLLKA
jgi:DNA-binding transcriptional MerR regulator